MNDSNDFLQFTDFLQWISTPSFKIKITCNGAWQCTTGQDRWQQYTGNEAFQEPQPSLFPVEATRLLVSPKVQAGVRVRMGIRKVKTPQGHRFCQNLANIFNKCFSNLCRALVNFHISEKLILTFFITLIEKKMFRGSYSTIFTDILLAFI